MYDIRRFVKSSSKTSTLTLRLFWAIPSYHYEAKLDTLEPGTQSLVFISPLHKRYSTMLVGCILREWQLRVIAKVYQAFIISRRKPGSLNFEERFFVFKEIVRRS
jgi:hypothetical protein